MTITVHIRPWPCTRKFPRERAVYPVLAARKRIVYGGLIEGGWALAGTLSLSGPSGSGRVWVFEDDYDPTRPTGLKYFRIPVLPMAMLERTLR